MIPKDIDFINGSKDLSILKTHNFESFKDPRAPESNYNDYRCIICGIILWEQTKYRYTLVISLENFTFINLTCNEYVLQQIMT